MNVSEQGRLCSQKCKEPCKWGEVESSVSTAQYPSLALVPALFEMFPDIIDPNRTVQQVVELKIYFRDRSVKVRWKNSFLLRNVYKILSCSSMNWRDFLQVVSRFQPMTLDQLISNLGGQLSLWAGISFLTILQAVFYFGSTLLHQPGIQVWAVKGHDGREAAENVGATELQ